MSIYFIAAGDSSLMVTDDHSRPSTPLKRPRELYEAMENAPPLAHNQEHEASSSQLKLHIPEDIPESSKKRKIITQGTVGAEKVASGTLMTSSMSANTRKKLYLSKHFDKVRELKLSQPVPQKHVEITLSSQIKINAEGLFLAIFSIEFQLVEYTFKL